MRHFLTILLIGCSTSLFAQNFTFSLVPSVSIPVSDFGSTDIENALANYADLGFGGNIEATVWLANSFGISVLAGASGNKLDNTTLANQLNEQFDLDFEVSEESYTILYALLGPSIGMNTRGVSISITPGVGYGIKSDLSYTAFVQDISAETQQINIDSDAGLMYGAQFSTKFFISDGFGLGLNASFISGNMENIGEKTGTISLPAEVIEQEFSPSIFTAGVNLSFRLGGGGGGRHTPGAGFYFGR